MVRATYSCRKSGFLSLKCPSSLWAEIEIWLNNWCFVLIFVYDLLLIGKSVSYKYICTNKMLFRLLPPWWVNFHVWLFTSCASDYCDQACIQVWYQNLLLTYNPLPSIVLYEVQIWIGGYQNLNFEWHRKTLFVLPIIINFGHTTCILHHLRWILRSSSRKSCPLSKT